MGALGALGAGGIGGRGGAAVSLLFFNVSPLFREYMDKIALILLIVENTAHKQRHGEHKWIGQCDCYTLLWVWENLITKASVCPLPPLS